jgi:hypothetical protein
LFCVAIKTPEAENFIKKRGLLAHVSGGSRGWYWHILSSGEGLMVDGITTVGARAAEIPW